MTDKLLSAFQPTAGKAEICVTCVYKVDAKAGSGTFFYSMYCKKVDLPKTLPGLVQYSDGTEECNLYVASITRHRAKRKLSSK
jgi:hypothetical protein